MRITATVAAMVLAALAGAGVVVYLVESQRLEQQAAEAADQELSELVRLQEDGIDPDTRRPFATVSGMLDTFLRRNVTDDDELLVAWLGDAPAQASARSVLLDPPDGAPAREFRSLTAPLVRSGGSARVEIAGRDLLVATQPVVQGDDRGALVVVLDLDRGRAELLGTMRTYAVVATLFLLAVTAVASWQSGRLLAPLRTLRRTADEIGGSDLSRRIPESGNDDITALTRTVNGMLDRLDAAFTAQRRFLDDAGHELKTPLTVLRGHLELLDTGSPAEVAETKELLLDEVDRMSRLVGDLILLAKSDRPDFVVPEPVDLGRLTDDLLAKARALGARDWRLDAAATVVVPADEQRLTQAVLQLADNAVKHTGPGDTVAIGSSYDGSTVRLWVRDTGPGVPHADREVVFERFGRSRVPEGDEGFGLGLSIVRAIARAHGGDVQVADADPARAERPGALFVLALPARAEHLGTSTATLEEPTWPAS